MKHFKFSFLITIVCLMLAAWWGYTHGGVGGALSAVGIAAILGVMEVSLSFDNAVVNASVLKTWDRFWQNLFLTIGMLVAVFGMRLFFPLAIVAAAADLGVGAVWDMALHDPAQYAGHLSDHHAEVAAFGGVFLLLVFLNFLMDDDKALHWLGKVERQLASLWKRCLDIARVGLDDNFFELGGQSVLALQLILDVDRELGVVLDGMDVLRESLEDRLVVRS